jgi:hypothetical protein
MWNIEVNAKCQMQTKNKEQGNKEQGILNKERNEPDQRPETRGQRLIIKHLHHKNILLPFLHLINFGKWCFAGEKTPAKGEVVLHIEVKAVDKFDQGKFGRC